MGASKLFKAGVDVHFFFPVKQHLDRPPKLATSIFPQVDGGRLLVREKLRELI
jgi:hypothetical protein